MSTPRDVAHWRTFNPLWFALTICAVFVVAVGIPGLQGPVQGQLRMSDVFPDIPAETELESAARILKNRGVVSGFPDGSFRPGDTINRAQAAKMLLLGSEQRVDGDHITVVAVDLPPGAWYTDYIAIASHLGIMQGYGNGVFRPAQTIIRSEFYKMLSIAFELQVNRRSSYPDVPDGVWFAPFAAVAETYDLLPDKQQIMFNPTQTISRGEAAYAIAQAMRVIHPELTPAGEP